MQSQKFAAARSLIAAAASFSGCRMGRWRKMETAPLDGTDVLVLTGDFGAVQAWYRADVPNFYRSNPKFHSYDPANMMGDWCSMFVSDDPPYGRLICGFLPRAWCPLPAIPKWAQPKWKLPPFQPHQF
jgi:hypothetical protein